MANSILIVYFTAIGFLAIYGLHRYALIYLYYRHRRENSPVRSSFDILPKVTIQLPIYNEPYVVKRLLQSALKIDYPKELLQVQILDDSDDLTGDIAKKLVFAARRQGFNIEHITRSKRSGFKAGALAAGLKKASGDFIAVFDADFVVFPEFLKEALPYFSQAKIGMVQAAWAHLNRDSSLLTKIQAMFIESHFAIEQAARFKSGRFFNFNGTAGIWRKECIIESGGWHTDTLAEDLDLSYRAQLKGWKFVYLEKALCVAELPIQMSAFKRQQKRWVQGTIQVAKKLTFRIIKSHYPAYIKIEALLHLTNYLVYIVSLLAGILILPSMLFRFNSSSHKNMFIDLTLLAILTFSVFSYHSCSLFANKNKPALKNIFLIPFLMAISMGLSISNSLAILEAFFKKKSVFYRTPKYGIISPGIKLNWGRARIMPGKITPYFEVFLGICFLYNLTYAFSHKFYQSVFFLALFSIGFFYVGILSFFDYQVET